MKKFKETAPEGVRVIKTARRIAVINAAAKKGFFPLVKKLIRSKKLFRKYFVLQDNDTGKIRMPHAVYSGTYSGNVQRVIEWSAYYPYSFPSPFAAYLIPEDLEKGAQVWLEDLIEDYVGGYENDIVQNPYRLESVLAEWTGEDFLIQYEPPFEPFQMIG